MHRLYAALLVGIALLFAARPAGAQGIPTGDYTVEWSNWMALAYVIAFTAAWACFFVAAKWGVFGDMEKAKYHILKIDEQYYHPSADDKEVGKDEPPADTADGH